MFQFLVAFALIITFLFGVGFYFYKKYESQIKMLKQVASVLTGMPLAMPDVSRSASDVSLEIRKKYIWVSFTLTGKRYELYLPRNSSYRGISVYLQRGGKQEVELLQPPQVPYLLPASHLGGTGYRVVNRETGDEVIVAAGNLISL